MLGLGPGPFPSASLTGTVEQAAATTSDAGCLQVSSQGLVAKSCGGGGEAWDRGTWTVQPEREMGGGMRRGTCCCHG